jgi:hypothetical protein
MTKTNLAQFLARNVDTIQSPQWLVKVRELANRHREADPAEQLMICGQIGKAYGPEAANEAERLFAAQRPTAAKAHAAKPVVVLNPAPWLNPNEASQADPQEPIGETLEADGDEADDGTVSLVVPRPLREMLLEAGLVKPKIEPEEDDEVDEPEAESTDEAELGAVWADLEPAEWSKPEQLPAIMAVAEPEPSVDPEPEPEPKPTENWIDPDRLMPDMMAMIRRPTSVVVSHHASPREMKPAPSEARSPRML